MPIDAAELVTLWTERFAQGAVNDLLCPVGEGTEAWVGQCMFDSGYWTIQVRPQDMAAFLEAHPQWQAIDDTFVFRNYDKTMSLDAVCADVSAVVETLEAQRAVTLEMVAS